MGRHRKWTTAALLAATAGLWATAFIAPGFRVDRDDVSDCRGLGILAGVALITWVFTGPRIRAVERRQDAQDAAWQAWREERGQPGRDPGRLRRVSGRSA